MALSAKALTTMSRAREFVLRDATDDRQDTKLELLINAYSSAIYAYTGREWLPRSTAQTRRFRYDGSGFLSLEPYDLRTLTSVTLYSDLPTADQRILVAGSSTVESEYRLMPPSTSVVGTYDYVTIPTVGLLSPFSPWASSWPVDRSRTGYEVAVLGDWGIASSLASLQATYPDVELACLIAVKDAYVNPEGLESRTFGELSISEAADVPGSFDSRAGSLPREARALLSPYKRGSLVAVA